MDLNSLVSAGFFSAAGLVVGKAADIWLSRANTKDSNSVTLVNHTSEQTKVLIDQLRSLIIDQTAQIKELTKERNGLQLEVFKTMPMAQKMVDFEDTLHDAGFTYEDCLLMIRELSTLPVGKGRRWSDHVRQLRPSKTTPDSNSPPEQK